MNSKIVLLTGGSRGLGRDMALNLAKEGVNIIFTYNSNIEKANSVVKEIQDLGQKARAFQLDTKQPNSVKTLIDNVTSYLKDINGKPNFDYLINNAGIGTFNTVANTSEEQFDEMMNIHLKSVYFLTKESIPYINNGGRIVNISSGLTRFSLPGMSAYAIMKGGVEVFTRYLSKELGERKITANVVAPGAITTDFAGGVNKQKDKQEIISNMTALGRVGRAEDIGSVVSFLCSDKAGWVNGQRIEVSGGMLV